MNDWLKRNRVALYVLVNLGLVSATLIGWTSSPAPFELLIYADLLFALCTVPLLWIEELNGRYALLGIFMSMYFLLFGALDMRDLIVGAAPTVPRAEFPTLAQIAALLGAISLLIGYRAAVNLVGASAKENVSIDWPSSTLLVVGLTLFAVGMIAVAYFQLVLATENTIRSTLFAFTSMGPFLTFLVMLGRLVQPLGAVILSYGYAKSRSPLWVLLITMVVASQVLLGFLTDTKETVLLSVVMVAVTKSLFDGRIAKMWLLAIVAFATILFPVLQANRVVRDEHGWDRAQVLANLGTVLDAAIEQNVKTQERPGVERSQTFLERVSGETVLEILFDKVTESGNYLHGSTLEPILFTFIPRLLVPDKVSVPVGQLFNRTFMHGGKDDFLYLSVSMLGEMYWNFGWSGVIVGNLLFGALLGFIGAKTSLAQCRSITRLLVLLLTVRVLCRGYEDSISISVVTWLRGMAAIGLLHLAFSRATKTHEASDVGAPVAGPTPASAAALRFSNLMR